MHSLRASRHLLQLLPQPALPEVSDFGAGTVDCRTSKRTSPDALHPCGLHTSSSTGITDATEQEGRLRSAVPRQCRNPARSRPRPQASRRGNRLLQRFAHLESEARASSPRPLRHSRRWAVARSHALGQVTRAILSFHPRAPSRFSRPICCWSPAHLSPAFLWGSDTARSAENIRRLVTAPVPKGLGRLCKTTFRWPGVCAPVSRPLYASCGHLQPSLAFPC